MATQAAETANPLVVIRQNLQAMQPEFKAALPEHVSVEKFTRVAMTAIQNTPALANADRRSLFGAFVRLAQDGLLPDGREAAVVMFGNKAQAMPMIAGILKKIRQSKEVAKVSAQVVYENDHFLVKYGFDEDVEHVPPKLNESRGEPIGAYATAVLKDGSKMLEVMSLEEIEKVRAVSRAARNGPWVSWWGEMARKSVMRRLSKRLPMSSDLEDEIFSRDETLTVDLRPVETPPPQAEPTRTSRLDAIEHQIEPHDEVTGELAPEVPAEIEAQADELEAEIEQQPEAGAERPFTDLVAQAEGKPEPSPESEKIASDWIAAYDGADAIMDLKGLHGQSELDRSLLPDEQSAEVDAAYERNLKRLEARNAAAKAREQRETAE